MAPAKYTLVFEDVPGSTMAIRADHPVLRHLRPTPPDDSRDARYRLFDDPWYMYDCEYMDRLSALQAAALLEMNAAYFDAVVDVGQIPRDAAVCFTRDELYTSREGGPEYADVVDGWTNDELLAVLCDLGFSARTEALLYEFKHPAVEIDAIKREVAAYKCAQKTSVVDA